jgi:hypothetical protein
MVDPKEASRCCLTPPRWPSRSSWTGSSSRVILAIATFTGPSSTPLAGPRAVSAVAKLLDRRDRLRRGLKALGASGQLGYGIPEKSRAAGLERAPYYIGADMGSIDPGPYYHDPASARRAQARHPAPDRHRRRGGCGAASRKDARHVRDIARAPAALPARLHSRRHAPPARQGSGAFRPRDPDRQHGAAQRGRHRRGLVGPLYAKTIASGKRGTEGSNPSPSANESVSPVPSMAIGAETRLWRGV